jgi:hypothetical protein
MVQIINLLRLIGDENSKIKKELVTYSQEPDEEKLLSYLSNGRIWVAVASLERCVFCDHFAGPRTYMTDGKWLWPKFILHYVEVHDLQLPASFLEHIRMVEYTIPVAEVDRIFGLPESEIEII